MELSKVELRPVNLHWLGEGDTRDDLCLHGGVYIKLGDTVISDEKSEWTTSIAAYRLLGTVLNEHTSDIDEALIPCCGFEFYPDDTAPDGVFIPNCLSGINWIVRHLESDFLAHDFGNGNVLFTDKKDWAESVIAFSDKVFEFYSTSESKNFHADYLKQGFGLFMKGWKERRVAAEV